MLTEKKMLFVRLAFKFLEGKLRCYLLLIDLGFPKLIMLAKCFESLTEFVCQNSDVLFN